jgi:hypothetical protein
MAWAGVVANALTILVLAILALRVGGRSGLEAIVAAIFPVVGVVISLSLLRGHPLALRALDVWLTLQWLIFGFLVVFLASSFVDDCTPHPMHVPCTMVDFYLQCLGLLLAANVPLFVAKRFWSRPAVRRRQKSHARSAGSGGNSLRD